jgi:predicted lipoprotein with Yx(FWY)xxD motif
MTKLWSPVLSLALLVLLLIPAVFACSSATGSSSPSGPTGATSRPASVASAASAVYADNIYLTKNDPSRGNYLTDFQGQTLYVYDRDSAGVSTVNADLAKIWRPYSSGATAQSVFPANISVITRTDGSRQFAWKGRPLYYYSKDLNVGDIGGDGVDGVWHSVQP